jgi:hypothetical protein
LLTVLPPGFLNSGGNSITTLAVLCVILIFFVFSYNKLMREFGWFFDIFLFSNTLSTKNFFPTDFSSPGERRYKMHTSIIAWPRWGSDI